jgi:hypothetical protein
MYIAPKYAAFISLSQISVPPAAAVLKTSVAAPSFTDASDEDPLYTGVTMAFEYDKNVRMMT